MTGSAVHDGIVERIETVSARIEECLCSTLAVEGTPVAAEGKLV